MIEKEGVSVIICCYNSSERITATLEHLQKVISNIPWEVILVDNNSSDDTKDKAQKIWNINPVTTFKIVSEEKRGLMNARIKGVHSSIYDIVSFIDDDNWIEPQWVEKVFSILQSEKSLAACGGSSEAVFEKNPPEWFPVYSIGYAVGKQQNESGFVKPQKGYLWGAGLTVRKSVWNELFNSGFHSLLKGRSGKSLTAGEDSEICLAMILLGRKLWYEDALKLKHYMPDSRLTLKYLIEMHKGFGKAEVILSLYRGFIYRNVGNKSSWLLQSFASLKRMGISGLNSIFSTGERNVPAIVKWSHDKAYSIELIMNRKKYNEAKIQIHQFVNRLKKLPPILINETNKV